METEPAQPLPSPLVGSRIAVRRKEKGWTLPRLAEESGVAKGYLSELENDKAGRPSATVLFKIAKALGTTIADLLGEKSLPERQTEIPDGLRQLAEDEQLTDDDVAMLAGISYRGERPTSMDDWRFILESIRRSVKRRPGQALHHGRSRRTWRSSVAKELAEATGIPDPIDAIRSLAAALLVKGDQAGPPVNLELLASVQNILRVERTALREAGRLVPTPDGLIVQVNAAESVGRQNFTIAHELGHTLLPSYHRQPAFRDETNVGSHSTSNEEEYLCDVAASALLLPEEWLRSRAEAGGRRVSVITDLAGEFSASLEATALAWSQLNLSPVAVIVWEERLKPSERRALSQPALPGLGIEPPAPKFRVSRFFRGPSFPYYIPQHKSAEDGAVVETAAVEQAAQGELVLNVGGEMLTLGCDAIYAPYYRGTTRVERVLSVVGPISA